MKIARLPSLAVFGTRAQDVVGHGGQKKKKKVTPVGTVLVKALIKRVLRQVILRLQ